MSDNFVYGIHVAKQLLLIKPQDVYEVFLQKSTVQASVRLQELQEQASQLGIALQWVEKDKLDKWTEHANHQGVVLRCKAAQARSEKELLQFLQGLKAQAHTPFFLVLDGVTDPHNLGACLRTAAAAGVDAVLIPRDKSAGLTAIVRKVAAGAADILPVFAVTNLARSLDMLKEHGIWVVGTALDEAAQNFYQLDLKGSLAIVMGSEGKGLRHLTQQKCDFLAYIPMSPSIQSLNVSVATGICLFEALRQRDAFPTISE